MANLLYTRSNQLITQSNRVVDTCSGGTPIPCTSLPASLTITGLSGFVFDGTGPCGASTCSPGASAITLANNGTTACFGCMFGPATSGCIGAGAGRLLTNAYIEYAPGAGCFADPAATGWMLYLDAGSQIFLYYLASSADGTGVYGLMGAWSSYAASCWSAVPSTLTVTL